MLLRFHFLTSALAMACLTSFKSRSWSITMMTLPTARGKRAGGARRKRSAPLKYLPPPPLNNKHHRQQRTVKKGPQLKEAGHWQDGRADDGAAGSGALILCKLGRDRGSKPGEDKRVQAFALLRAKMAIVVHLTQWTRGKK